jgi:hypothetical protein
MLRINWFPGLIYPLPCLLIFTLSDLVQQMKPGMQIKDI